MEWEWEGKWEIFVETCFEVVKKEEAEEKLVEKARWIEELEEMVWELENENAILREENADMRRRVPLRGR